MAKTDDLSFTILINNYNYGKFLASAIESALAQTWRKVQVLVVDDGSTDNSLEVAARFAASNYEVLSKPNGGQNSAIAFGLPYARGDYTIILDSDDWLKPCACETLADAVGSRRPNGVLYKLEKTDLEGNIVGVYPDPPFSDGDPRDHIRRHGYISCAPTSGNAFKTAFLRDAFRHIQPDTPFCDGYLVWAAGWTREIICLDKAIGCYLVHGRNVSQRKSANDAERRFKTNNYVLDHFRHLFCWLEARGEQPIEWIELIDAYTWQRILYFKLTKGAYPEFSFEQCRRHGVRRFLNARHHGIYKQTKNILFLALGARFGALRDMTS
jgi:glycosyltransferase involved in cell wall biosynthesis